MPSMGTYPKHVVLEKHQINKPQIDILPTHMELNLTLETRSDAVAPTPMIRNPLYDSYTLASRLTQP